MVKQRRKTSSSRRRRKSGGNSAASRMLFLVLGGFAAVALYVFIICHFFVTPFSFRWRGIFGNMEGPEGYEIRGIDISHYQEHINWEVLRNSKVGSHPISFVIIKATEGLSLMDDNFNDNFYRAKQHDLIRGAYHYFHPTLSPKKQAEFFLKQVHLEPGDIPPVLDVEDRGKKPLAEFRRDVKTWLDLVETAYGVTPILYTGYKFKVDYLSSPEFSKYKFWIAHYYVQELAYKGDWMMWQYTDAGKVDGVRGRVDCNLFNGSMLDLQELLIPDPSTDFIE